MRIWRELEHEITGETFGMTLDCPIQFFRCDTISSEEFKNLRCQFGTSSSYGGRRYRPYAFTEQGVAMLSSVLRSKRAVQVNVQIMRTFVKLRQLLSSHADLARKLAELEQRYDGRFRQVFAAINALMSDQEEEKQHQKRKRIGYHTESGRA